MFKSNLKTHHFDSWQDMMNALTPHGFTEQDGELIVPNAGVMYTLDMDASGNVTLKTNVDLNEE